MTKKRWTRVVKRYILESCLGGPHNHLGMSGKTEGHRDNFLALGLRNSVNGDIITQNRIEI